VAGPVLDNAGRAVAAISITAGQRLDTARFAPAGAPPRSPVRTLRPPADARALGGVVFADNCWLVDK